MAEFPKRISGIAAHTACVFFALAAGGCSGSDPAAPSCVARSTSLVAWWDGDLLSALVAKDRISVNHGTMSSTTITGTPGMVGNAFGFPSLTSSVIRMSASSALDFTTGMSVAAWVKGTGDARASNKIQAVLGKWGFNDNGFGAASNWTGIDVSGASVLNNAAFRGFSSGVFDGRYLYFVPNQNTTTYSGSVARYDTQSTFSASASWEGVDFSGAAILNDTNCRGYSSAAFDGRYVYFIPLSNGSYHSCFVRYDTQAAFDEAASWTKVDISGADILDDANYRGFSGAAFDGRYLYLVPLANGSGPSGNLVRYDTRGEITAASSWTGVDIAGTSALNSASYKGFGGAVYDGRYLYFVPTNNGAYHGSVARYDTRGELAQATSWKGADISGASLLNSANYRGFSGGLFDGRYVYFVPFRDATFHGNLARFDTFGEFNAASSWTGVDVAGAALLNNAAYKGFAGANYDGRYLYLIPYRNNGAWSSLAVRYDTRAAIDSNTSWTGVDIASYSILNNTGYRGFLGAAFDGRYLYFVPAPKASSTDGMVARYDTTGSAASYALKYSDALSDGFSTSLPGLSFTINTENGPATVQHHSSLAANTWFHVAATYDNLTLRLYVNGAQVATRSASGAIVTSISDLGLGGYLAGRGLYDGLLDEVMLFRTALDAEDIAAISGASTAGVCK